MRPRMNAKSERGVIGRADRACDLAFKLTSMASQRFFFLEIFFFGMGFFTGSGSESC